MKIINEKKGTENCSLLYLIEVKILQPEATCDDEIGPGPPGWGGVKFE